MVLISSLESATSVSPTELISGICVFTSTMSSYQRRAHLNVALAVVYLHQRRTVNGSSGIRQSILPFLRRQPRLLSSTVTAHP